MQKPLPGINEIPGRQPTGSTALSLERRRSALLPLEGIDAGRRYFAIMQLPLRIFVRGLIRWLAIKRIQ